MRKKCKNTFVLLENNSFDAILSNVDFQISTILKYKAGKIMKKDIHPTYGDAIVTCACGEVWHIKSTRPEYKVGICAKCHPFFTGKQKFVDTAGRIDKFNRRYKKA